jgi:hypothetical protein
MADFLRRHYWGVNLVVIAALAGLGAHAARHILEARFVPVTLPSARPAAVQPPPVEARDKAGHALFANNIFCSTCPPPGPAAGPGGDAREAQSRLPVTLVGTLITPEAIRSVAVIRDSGPGPAPDPDGGRLFPVAAYRPGDRVAGYAAVVERVDARRVYLRVNGRLEYLDLPTAPPPRKGAHRPTRSPRGAI